MKTSKLLQLIVTLVFFAFLLLMLYQIVQKISGHSPSTETILSTSVVMIISFLLMATLKFSEFMGETKAFMKSTKESFRMMREDVEKLRNP